MVNKRFMPTKNAPTRSISKPSHRTRIVWASFAAAMTAAVGILALGDQPSHPQGFVATNLVSLGEQPAADPVFQIDAPVDRQRWKSIVIHHLGSPAGDADSVHRRHLSYGYQGLGYHFLIGNGNGMGDGVVHVGYRWNEQLPGVHTVGEHADFHNRHSIAICLIGNGDRRPFTDRQLAHLTSLVQRLQRELDIPASEVYLHREVATGVHPPETGPGRFFARAQFEEQLR